MPTSSFPATQNTVDKSANLRSFHVLIIGGGLVGPFLYHALQKSGISSTIYERDESPTARGQGWGITLHLALSTLSTWLPEALYERLQEALVDPEYPVITKETFPFIDAATMAVKSNTRYLAQHGRRYSRSKLRQLLLTDTNIEWGKRLASISTTSSGVTAYFADGTSASGAVLIGVDGANSLTRRYLGPEKLMRYTKLPFSNVGLTTRVSSEKIRILREQVDPLVFRATHSESGVSMWWAILEALPDNDYIVQLNISWVLASSADELPASHSSRLALIKRRCQNFAAPLRDLILTVPEDTVVTEITLADWIPVPWNNLGGRVTLAGDAAHPMTMCMPPSYVYRDHIAYPYAISVEEFLINYSRIVRGENANQGLIDAGLLAGALDRVVNRQQALEEAINCYEDEMRSRTTPGILAGRKACFNAHATEANARREEGVHDEVRAQL